MAKSAYSELKSSISSCIKAALESYGYKTDGIDNSIDLSKGIGDISCSISFRLAKEYKKNPDAIANEIKSKITKIKYVEKITVEGGFINFHLERSEFSSSAIHYALNYEDLKRLSDLGKGISVIVEYPSANPVHPLHVGQLRNALLGESISRICESCSYEVERENYIDDLGLQMVQAVWGHLHLEAPPEMKFDHRIGRLYVDANKQMESRGMKEEISNLTHLIEQDGTYESKLTRELAEMCTRAQYETLFDYGIYQDLLVWESDIVREKLLDRAMDLLLKRNLIEKIKEGEYKDCIVIDLSKIKELPKGFENMKENIKVLIRSNGTPTYVAKDIAFHMWKFGMLENNFKYVKFIEQRNGKTLYSTGSEGSKMDFGNMQRAINIIDARQSHPQEILKLAFRGMGRNEIADNLIHFAYGKVDLEDGALAGRKGTWIGNTADDVLAEAVRKASALINSKSDIGKDEQGKIARNVALSAIKFEFLRFSPEKYMIFSWKSALNFEGNSGPYAQYMHARATRILEEAPKGLLAKELSYSDISDHEFGLVKLLSKADLIAEKAAHELRPNVIAEYINELSQTFAAFYDRSPILRAESDAQKAFRLQLALAFKNTTKAMLALLGIEALDRM